MEINQVTFDGQGRRLFKDQGFGGLDKDRAEEIIRMDKNQGLQEARKYFIEIHGRVPTDAELKDFMHEIVTEACRILSD